MSITDTVPTRLTRAANRTFGNRKVPPAPPLPPLIDMAAIRQWLAVASAAMRQRFARASSLLRQALGLAPSIVLAWLRTLGIASIAWSRAALTARRTRKQAALISRRKRKQAWSRQKAIRAILYSDVTGTFVRLFAYLCALLGLSLAVAHVVRSTPLKVEAEAPPPVEWIHVAKPFPAFSLSMPELSESGFDYAMRRHAVGAGRKDILTWGELEDDAPHMRVEVYRAGKESPRFEAPELEIAARLQDLDSATLKPAGTLETKFGQVPLVEISITNPARQCLAFVRAYDRPRLQILGWHCASGTAPIARDLACALDRLVLVAAGSAPKLRELFARAELKRNFCGQRNYLMTPTPKLGPSAPPPARAWSGEVGAGSPKKTMRHSSVGARTDAKPVPLFADRAPLRSRIASASR